MLLMNGSDHLLPQPWLGRVVAAANASQDDYRFTVTSLGEYVREQPVDGLDHVVRRAAIGRARERARWAWRRTGSTCTRRAAHAERSLERLAEPLERAAPPAARLPAALLDVGWRQLDPQQRARLVVRVQRRRGRRGGARALPGGAPRRRGAHPRRAPAARDDDRRAAVVDHRREQHRPPACGLVDGPAARHRSGAPGGGRRRHRLPHPGRAHDRGRGHLHRRGRPEDPVGPRDDAGTGAGRRPHRTGRATARSPTAPSRVHVPRRRSRGDPSSTSRRPRRPCWRSARRVPPSPSASAARRCARSSWPPIACPASAGARTARSRAPARHRGARRRARRWPTSTCRSRSTPPTAPLTIEADGVTRGRALNRYVDGGDGGDTYNYSPPAVDTVVDRPESVRVARRRSGPGASPDSSSPRPTAGPRTPSATNGRAHAAATTPVSSTS